MSEEQEERIEIDIDTNNGDFDESSDIAEEIIKEVVEVVEKSDTPLSSMEKQQEKEEDQKNEIEMDNSNRYNGDIYEQLKAQSIQLSSLADMVQSLQSLVKQLQETIRLRKTSSVRKKSTSSNRIKTKKKTKRRGSARSKKK
ncbi:MAG TPA: hypothetical protein VN922_08510 [Bacteroidia bacterium]|nr:hypothetical protein [Bacteroidia bacterium]